MNKLLLNLILIHALFANEDLFLAKDFTDDLSQHSSYSIVILPFQNASIEPEVSYHFRKRVAQILRSKGYTIVSFDYVDKELMNLGVQSAEQISLVNFKTLAKLTSADAILSGIVETATTENAALYSGYAFTGSLKLQDSLGNVKWYHLSQRVAKRRLALDPVNMILNTALDNDSNKTKEAISAVADRLLAPFPNGPIQVIEDDLLNQAIELGEH